MPYTERTRLEEVLIRVGLDANGMEKITGAHSQTITEGLVDGVVRFAAPSSVTPLALDGMGIGALTSLLGGVTATALANNELLRASLMSVNEANSQLSITNAELRTMLEEARKQITELRTSPGEVESLVTDLKPD